ncbi:MAG: LTA synthase family protein [Thiothrix sp.]|nr:LTA synthase family protein [Thiothrix sp.]
MLLTGLLLTLILAQLSHNLLPHRLRPGKRPVGVWLLQQLGLACLYSLILLLVDGRPLLSSLLVLVLLAIVLVVNQAKFHALREPLLFSDLYLYLQVFRHPRLFLPFLNLPLVLGASLLGAGLLYAALQLEPPHEYGSHYPYSLLAGLALPGWLSWRLARDLPLTFDPDCDVQQLGLYVSLLVYGIQTRLPVNRQALQTTLANSHLAPPDAISRTILQPPDKRPDIVVVQSESFFDARRLPADIRTKILAHFDHVHGESLLHGRLDTPAWGANTLRPEFSFLSGISNRALKHYRFNPYAFLPAQPLTSIVSVLNELGYECLCIHPNQAGFFNRDQVFPQLGFQQFIDIDGFTHPERAGPYVSDAACAGKILEQLQAPRPQQRPRFIFAITMENHGPLHLEPLAAGALRHYRTPPAFRHHDLTVYLHHLHNADRMLHQLTQALRQQERQALLCWYGDHVPSMPAVYQDLGYPDGATDFLLWHNQHPSNTSQPQSALLKPDALAQQLLQTVIRLASEPSEHHGTGETTAPLSGSCQYQQPGSPPGPAQTGPAPDAPIP